MISSSGSRILRNVEFESQPVALAPLHRSRAREMLPQPPARFASAKECARGVAVLHDSAYSEGLAQGIAEGRRLGLAKGMDEADTRVQEAIASAVLALEAEAARHRDAASTAHTELARELGELVRNFESEAAIRLESLERDAVALAFEAVCRIVGDGGVRPEQVAGCVGRAMQDLRGKRLLRVRLHPNDLEGLLACAEGTSLTEQWTCVEWLADASVLSGGAVFDTDLGSIDARIEVQLSHLRQLWFEGSQLSRRPSERQA